MPIRQCGRWPLVPPIVLATALALLAACASATDTGSPFTAETGRSVSPASPEKATCSGWSCSGLSPDATGCKDSAYTVETLTRTNVIVRLRCSTECGACWSWVTRADGLSGYLEAEIAAVDLYTGAEVGGMTATSTSATSLKSPMLYAEGYGATACGRGTSSAAVKCTGVY